LAGSDWLSAKESRSVLQLGVGNDKFICHKAVNYSQTDIYMRIKLKSLGTGIRGLMRGMATLPKVTRSY